MKKLLTLLAVLLCLCSLSQAEDDAEYVLKGWQGNAVMTQSGVRATLPDGLSVYPQVDLTDEDDPLALIPIRLPGMNDRNAVEALKLYYTLEVRVDNGETHLVNIGDYG